MQDQYPADFGPGPPEICPSHAATRPARLLLCAGCRVQVLICSRCDRGQIYCPGGCAGHARRTRQGSSAKRYQGSARGRRHHAARQGRYRARLARGSDRAAAAMPAELPVNKVTHQGPPPPAPDDLLPPGAPVSASDASEAQDQPRRAITHCHWCGRRCPERVRQGFLRRRVSRRRLL